MINFVAKPAALDNDDLRSAPVPVIPLILAITTIWSGIRAAYGKYIQDNLLTGYGTVIDDIFGRIPGIDNLLVVDHSGRWFVVAFVVGTVFCVVVIIRKIKRDRARRKFYEVTDANPVERSLVGRLTAGFPALMREHGIGVHATAGRVSSGGARTRVTPPILRRITMEPSGLRIAVRPATGQSASELADQWEKSASIFQQIDFDTDVERNGVYVQLYTRTGGAPDVTLKDLNGGDK